MDELEPKDVLEAGAKALFGPVHDLFLKLTGPAAEEYGLMWGESVRLRRTKRLVSGLAKTKRMVEEAGFEPQIVPDKLLLPIFEGMSLEDDAFLQERWAALLTNTASSKTIHPAFVNFLTEISTLDAHLLMSIRTLQGFETEGVSLTDLLFVFAGLGTSEFQRHVLFNNLERLGLIGRREDKGDSHFSMTPLGVAFIDACTPPKPATE